MTHDELPDHLARALKALDDQAAHAAARLDPARVASGVIARLAAEAAPVPRVAPWRRGALRIAAAAVVVVLGGVLARRLVTGAAEGPAAVAVGLPVSLSADSLDAGQANELLAAVEQVRPAAAGVRDSAVATPATITVDDLNETELQTLLQIMESSEETLE